MRPVEAGLWRGDGRHEVPQTGGTMVRPRLVHSVEEPGGKGGRWMSARRREANAGTPLGAKLPAEGRRLAGTAPSGKRGLKWWPL